MRIAVVEDDEKTIDYIHSLLLRFKDEFSYEVDIDKFYDGMSFIEDFMPVYDLVIMDIEMPYLNGISTAREMREIDDNVTLLFITNAPQYAIKGYEVGALDYILKPVEYYALSLKLQKVFRKIKQYSNEYIMLQKGDIVNKINISDITYVEVQKHDVTYHTIGREYHTIGTLKDAENKLPQETFIKCNSCYLINVKYVDGVEKDAVFIGNTSLKISRPKKREFMEKLLSYYKNGGR